MCPVCLRHTVTRPGSSRTRTWHTLQALVWVRLQADVALMPFYERFRLCLQLTQDYDLSAVQGGSITAWLVGS